MRKFIVGADTLLDLIRQAGGFITVSCDIGGTATVYEGYGAARREITKLKRTAESTVCINALGLSRVTGSPKTETDAHAGPVWRTPKCALVIGSNGSDISQRAISLVTKYGIPTAVVDDPEKFGVWRPGDRQHCGWSSFEDLIERVYRDPKANPVGSIPRNAAYCI